MIVPSYLAFMAQHDSSGCDRAFMALCCGAVAPRRSELTDDVAAVYATWMRMLATDVVQSCTSRCLACRSRTPPQCVLCGGVACCPSEEMLENLVSAPGGDVLPMLADQCGPDALGAKQMPERLLALAFAHGSVCILCRYWHIGRSG